VLYVLTGLYAVGFIALLAAGEPRDTLVDGAQVSREVVTLVFLAVLLAGYLSLRPKARCG
jgi:hypothetical protein